jgi:hypothetical protein
VHQVVELVEAIVVVMAVVAVQAVDLVDNMVQKVDPQEQQDLVVQDHKAVMELADTQEQVAVAVPHLELLVTLV